MPADDTLDRARNEAFEVGLRDGYQRAKGGTSVNETIGRLNANTKELDAAAQAVRLVIPVVTLQGKAIRPALREVGQIFRDIACITGGPV